MGKKITVLGCLLASVFLMNSFISDNPYFSISKKDVILVIPKGFPKPVYQFKDNKLSPEIFILGRELFHDPILSQDSSISCSACHQRFAAFAHIDHPLSHGIRGLIGKRNVPALQNLIWKDALMADGAVNNLEVQPLAPITNSSEMGETLAHDLLKLQRSKKYLSLFKKAFGDTVINSKKMLKAMAQFVGLMISADSRYDRFTAGKDTLSKTELKGLEIFRRRCTQCHKEPLFTDNTYRNIGLKPDTALKDSGLAAITGDNKDYMKFKVPSLRNVEMTYPYMHDGRFRNLQQVMNHYGDAAFFTSNVDVLFEKKEGLTASERIALIAFLKTLTDPTFLHDKRFADPHMGN